MRTFPDLIAGIPVASVPGGWPEGFPPRSAFFEVSPAGECGADFEDLYSLFRRICAAHLLHPFMLARRAIAPLANAKNAADYVSCLRYYLINGDGVVAERWCVALEQLTLRSGLRSRTLLPLKHFVPIRDSVLTAEDRYCSDCFRDDETHKRPKYHRLLWNISLVEACPLHGTVLQCDKKNHAGRRNPYWLPGISWETGANLAGVPSTVAPSEKVELARLIASLLDEVCITPEVFLNGEHAVTDFVRYAVKVLFDGNVYRFSEHLKVSRTLVDDWLRKQVHPTLLSLTLIAHCCGCKIADVLLGRQVTLTKHPAFTIVKPTCRPRAPAPPAAELNATLAHFLKSDDDVLTAKEIATLVGINTGRLKQTVRPEIWSALLRRLAEKRQEKQRYVVEQRFNEFLISFTSLKARGIYPSARNVADDVQQRTGSKPLDWNYAKFCKEAHQLRSTSQKRLTPCTNTGKPANLRRLVKQ
ncbi:TniQ family protein [Paraburkholderia phenoliruptrix]|uniref:TniQ family protein n=1 Tax=Paraburkholderia phenoliruptrix TaxID=252970 RepID=UPI002869E6C7|nr:TniQ family protein [Paraburkholderia phenoliruptrix]WMY11749.1 TniQ family protein [Paraburkholderia phenoliruptrix]